MSWNTDVGVAPTLLSSSAHPLPVLGKDLFLGYPIIRVGPVLTATNLTQQTSRSGYITFLPPQRHFPSLEVGSLTLNDQQLSCLRIKCPVHIIFLRYDICSGTSFNRCTGMSTP